MDTHDKAIERVEQQLPAQGDMHPLVRAAVANGGLDPQTLRDLLAVQREWEAGEAKRAYTRALTALKRDLPTVIGRDQTVAYGNTRYTHSSLAQVMDAVTTSLTSHGFSLAWEPGRSENGDVSVTCRLTHSEGHSETCTLTAPPDSSGNKSKPQQIASTITLLQRYSALSLLGIATADHREPTGETEPAPDKVDSNRNLKAAAALKKYGKTRADAEEYLGRKLPDWTEADIGKLKQWVKPEPTEEQKKAWDNDGVPPFDQGDGAA